MDMGILILELETEQILILISVQFHGRNLSKHGIDNFWMTLVCAINFN